MTPNIARAPYAYDPRYVCARVCVVCFLVWDVVRERVRLVPRAMLLAVCLALSSA